MPKLRQKLENPYTNSVAWCRADKAVRAETSEPLRGASKGYRWQRTKIAALGKAWGGRLDQLGATFYQARWVASPDPRKRLAEVESRYRALVALLEERSRFESFAALVAGFASIDPHTGEQVPPVAPLADDGQEKATG